MNPLTIPLAGELDFARRAELDAVVELGLSARGDVVLDLHAVSFLDSSGLGAIARLADGVHERGCSLRLAGATDRVLSVLELAGLDRAVEVDALSGDQPDGRHP